MAITTEQVKELRDLTGISVMQCRKALEAAGGDIQKALAILKKESASIAEKKGSRELKAGRVAIKSDSKKAVLVTLLCETDFVAQNADFVNLLNTLTETALKDGVAKMEASAKEQIDGVIQKTGENIVLGDAYEMEGEVLGTYVHNNKSGVMVTLSGGTPELAKDLAMHITAMKPEYMRAEDITDEAKKMMVEVFQKEVANVNKPEEIKKKVLAGKIDSYFKEKTLLHQPFIKNGEVTIGAILAHANASIKEVKRYTI